jgi:hypothetical protein
LSLPPAIGGLTSLELLDLSTGMGFLERRDRGLQLTKEIERLSSLKTLNFSGNAELKLTAEEVRILKGLRALEKLGVGGTKISGQTAKHILGIDEEI